MNWNRAKNIILCMLIAINLTLLCYLSVLLSSRRNSFREAAEGAVQFLASQGISCDLSLIQEQKDERRLCVIERDTVSERKAAEVLLGSAEISCSGSIDRYLRDGSSLSWATGGNLEGSLDFSAADAFKRLSHAEINVSAEKTDVQSTDSRKLVQYIDKLPVFNAMITLQEQDGKTVLSGRCIVGTPIPADDKTPMSITGILIEYAKNVSGQGVERITAIDLGWIAQTLPGIGVRLVPVYRIAAEDSFWYINAVDGNLILSE